MRNTNPQQTDRKRADATERKASKFDGNIRAQVCSGLAYRIDISGAPQLAT